MSTQEQVKVHSSDVELVIGLKKDIAVLKSSVFMRETVLVVTMIVTL